MYRKVEIVTNLFRVPTLICCIRNPIPREASCSWVQPYNIFPIIFISDFIPGNMYTIERFKSSSQNVDSNKASNLTRPNASRFISTENLAIEKMNLNTLTPFTYI